MNPSDILVALQADLAQAQAGAIAVDQLAARWRGPVQPLLDALPPKFTPVWHNLLDRLESAASFSEESCAVSQRDLLAALAHWIERAQASH